MKKKEQLRHKYILYLKKTKKNETKSGKEKELEKKRESQRCLPLKLIRACVGDTESPLTYSNLSLFFPDLFFPSSFLLSHFNGKIGSPLKAPEKGENNGINRRIAANTEKEEKKKKLKKAA